MEFDAFKAISTQETGSSGPEEPKVERELQVGRHRYPASYIVTRLTEFRELAEKRGKESTAA